MHLGAVVVLAARLEAAEPERQAERGAPAEPSRVHATPRRLGITGDDGRERGGLTFVVVGDDELARRSAVDERHPPGIDVDPLGRDGDPGMDLIGPHGHLPFPAQADPARADLLQQAVVALPRVQHQLEAIVLVVVGRARGDPPGFVRILDDRTLLLPERPGNRLADSLVNILHNPRVGLLFVVPGVTDTFRVNGRATLVTDAALLALCVVEGKAPALGILVDIDIAYTQCAKAFLRSHLWDPARFIERAALPTTGEIHRALQGDDFDVEGFDRERAERYARREGFY